VAGSTQLHGRGQGQRSHATLITDARSGASKEMSSRVRRYTYTMAFRTACFIAMIFVPGMFRWVLFACAVFLPLIAVIVANQANRRSASQWAAAAIPTPASDAPQLTTGHESDQDTDGSHADPADSDVRGGRVA
jgi:type III secretory pathway component EscV